MEKNKEIAKRYNEIMSSAELIAGLKSELALIGGDDELTEEAKFEAMDKRIREASGLLEHMKDQAYYALRAVRS